MYDIGACHYTILEKLGFDLSMIDKDNKEKRNIQIGKLMRVNPRLTNILRKTTDSTIDEYLLRNKVKEDEVVLRQYDGVIITRSLREKVDQYIPLDLRSHFEVFIISVDRNKYIAFDGTNVTIKGVPRRYKAIDEIYNQVARINFGERSSIFKGLQKIRDKVLTSPNPELYCFPGDNDECNIFLKEYGEVTITKQTIKMMDIDDIDRQKYFDLYLRPFTKSIVTEFV